MASQAVDDTERPRQAHRRRQRRYAEPNGTMLTVEDSRQGDQSHSRPITPPQSLLVDGNDNLTTLDKVLDFVRSHQIYTSPGNSQASDLPKFDDISRYGINEADEDELWKIEAERLHRAVEDFSQPLIFKNPRLGPWEATKAGFEDLACVADQVLCNLSLCCHDNQLVLFEYFRDLFEPKTYVKSRTIISTRFDQHGTLYRTAARKLSEKPKLLAKRNSETYCALVDHVTAVVARFTLKGIPIEYWHTRALSGLARCAAKLKFLAIDPDRFAIQSLEDGQDVLAKDEALHAMGMPGQPQLDIVTPEGFIDARGHGSGDRERQSRASDVQQLLRESDPRNANVYFSEMALVSSWTFDSLQSVFYTLRGSPMLGYGVDAFDICSLIYKAGLNNLPTLIHQDRDGELSGTTSRDFIRMSHAPFLMAHQVAQAIRQRREAEANESITSPPPAVTPTLLGPEKTTTTTTATAMITPESHGSQLILEYQADTSLAAEKAAPEIIRLDLQEIPDTVSVMVPLLCTQPVTMMQLVWAIEIVTAITDVSNSIDFSNLPASKFTAFASLMTAAYKKKIQPELTDLDVDVRPLSRSLLAQGRLYTWNRKEMPAPTKPPATAKTAVPTAIAPPMATMPPPAAKATWGEQSQDQRRKAIDEAAERLQTLERTVEDWVIEEKVIIVRKLRYVLIVMVSCGILVVGGILVGVLLGDRLAGVDPFNITTFAWVLAGFILLVAKSLLVADWPWRDFLRGRVPCRSVSELETVTGVAAQDTLEYLLSKEPYTILVTKGPFNRPFARRSGDGFSIDVKIELRTLVASGIIVVKVASRQGPALVCLDLRRGTPGKGSIQHSDRIKDDERVLGCFEFPEAFDDGQEVPLQEVSMNWMRILGIYHRPYKLFR